MSDEPTETAGYSLAVSFPDESPSYTHGFEAGGIWQRMKAGREVTITATTHVENREFFRRAAVAEGWSCSIQPTTVEGWDELTLVKEFARSTRPNPHGLRVIEAGDT